LFSGDVSSLFTDLSNLEVIDLSKNTFANTLPAFSKQAPIRFGNFADNDFSGPLPTVRSQFTKQTHLYLQNNNLE